MSDPFALQLYERLPIQTGYGCASQGKGQQSIDAEAALQGRLAKQLGLKRKTTTKKSDPEDNLDEFLTGNCRTFASTWQRQKVLALHSRLLTGRTLYLRTNNTERHALRCEPPAMLLKVPRDLEQDRSHSAMPCALFNQVSRLVDNDSLCRTVPIAGIHLVRKPVSWRAYRV